MNFWVVVVLKLLRILADSERSSLTDAKILHVGLIAADDNNTELATDLQYIGWGQVAAGIGVAWDRIVSERILPEYDILNLTWVLSNCDEANAAGAIMRYAESKAHVVLGPPCTRSALVGGSVAKSYNFPIVTWGPPYSQKLLDQFEYPTVVSTSYSSVYQAQSLLRMLDMFKWQEIAIVYYATRGELVPRCTLLLADFDSLMNNSNITITYRRQIRSFTNETWANTLASIKDVARIVVVCLESADARRSLMISVVEQGMDTKEYVWLMVEARRSGFDPTFFTPTDEDDGKTPLAMKAAKRFLILDIQPLNDTTKFTASVVERFRDPPFNCPTCDNVDPTTSNVGQLADAMLLYAYTLNRSLAAGIAEPTGDVISKMARGEFDGFTGKVIINDNGTRNPVFIAYVLDADGKQLPVFMIREDLDNSSDPVTLLVKEEQIWATRGGVRPLSTPACGYTGADCPKSFAEQYLAVTLGSSVGGVFLIVAFILAICVIIRTKRAEEERLNQLWQVPLTALTKPPSKDIQSSRSLQSSVTTSTKLTINSKKDTERHAFFFYGGESIVARKHNARSNFTKSDSTLLRKMRNVDNDNLCKFFGICIDGSMMMSIWRYCIRGSLKDVIAKGSLQIDWFFKYSLIRDVAEAMYYLHHTIGPHGWLSSGTALIDERWQVKVTFYGMDAVKRFESKQPSDFLHVCPEQMRDPSLPASKEGDVYSFAIICSEVITKKSAWDLENENMDLDELIFKIRKGGRNPHRPSLETDDEHNASMSLLVRDCWNEDPDMRPNCDQIKTLIKSLNQNRSANLMDHVFNVLEQYASNLESEVQARMQELTEEKKKSDILLYRMLPKQVAEKLKLGQSVEPETFDCVTIFFSDVVSFTTLASRCSPLQVVNLLNDLYTTFDAIIDNHDVYKVETIGDGYLCVSGLPHRNGNEHAREIAEMSVSMLRAIKTFRVPHLPAERINIRIGLHTGPVVTGVVGVTMPRYCLFGDSVNTASRMESNGKPGKIHISTDTMKFLTETIGGYRTEPRGEVLVKGKGAVETHWLITGNE